MKAAPPQSYGTPVFRKKAWADIASDDESDGGRAVGDSPPPRTPRTPLAVASSPDASTELGHMPMSWPQRARDLAKQLEALASAAPLGAVLGEDVACFTDVTAAHLQAWEAAALRFVELRGFGFHWRVRADAAEAQVSFRLASVQQAQDSLAEGAKKEEEQQHEHEAAAEVIRSSERAEADAEAGLDIEKERAERQAAERREKLAALRQDVDARAAAAEKAAAVASSAKQAKESLRVLPGLEKRRSEAQATVARATKERDHLQSAVATVQAELDARAGPSKVDTLEKRVEQLEAECKALQEGDGAQSQDREAELASELAALKERSRALVAMVKEERCKKDKASSNTKQLRMELKRLANERDTQKATVEEMMSQVQGQTESREHATEETERRRTQIAELESQCKDQDAAATRMQERAHVLEEEIRSLAVRRREAEGNATRLEYKLQQAVQQLNLDKPAGVGRCLAAAKLRVPALQGQRSNYRSCASSDGDSREEMSTAAGESGTDGEQMRRLVAPCQE